jgi:hypothetical protein
MSWASRLSLRSASIVLTREIAPASDLGCAGATFSEPTKAAGSVRACGSRDAGDGKAIAPD